MFPELRITKMLEQVCTVQKALATYQELDTPFLIHSEYSFISLSPDRGIWGTLLRYANSSLEKLQQHIGATEVHSAHKNTYN